MQCIGTSTAWRASSTAIKFVRSTQIRAFSLRQLVGRRVFDSTSTKAKFASLAHAFVATAVRDTSITPSPLPVADLPQQSPQSTSHKDALPQKPYTTAQLSRAAAQSVRLACQNSSSREAFLIIKSLQESVIQYDKKNIPDKYALGKVAIDFGQAVCPRLAIHSLLHGLVRRGMTKKAGTIAWQILRSDVRLNPHTLHFVTKALCMSDIHALRDDGFREQIIRAKAKISFPGKRPPEKGWRSIKRILQTPSTRLAAQLFFAAKQYQRQRAKQMFQQLIDACLLQGEIVVVSFLFAFLVKKWQFRNALANDESDAVSDVDGLFLSPQNSQELSFANIPFPATSFMLKALTYINSAIFNTPLPDPHAIKPSFEEAAQALAILAGMLEDNMLPLKNLSFLISTLTSFPSTPSVKVWTRRNGKWILKDARCYFDEVLDELVKDVTGPDVGEHGHRQLDRRSHNALLHYALRRKLSLGQGKSIIKRMAMGVDVRPDITTYNILLRTGTLFRRNDLSAKVLEVLRERSENFEHSIMYKPSYEPAEAEQDSEVATGSEDLPLQIAETDASRTEKVKSSARPISPFQDEATLADIIANLPAQIQCIFAEDFDMDFVIASDSDLRGDHSTLNTYISHLTATGNPEVVATLIFFLIPELQVVDHPAHDTVARRLRRQALALNRRTAVQRAIALGPHFFTVVLNALVKAGRTGLAERVWLLAKQAEVLSWDPQFAGTTPPWALPIAAYTVMMQCYAAEARKGLDMQYLGRSANRYKHMHSGWTPKHNGTVKGWAYFVVNDRRRRRDNSVEVGRLEAGREMGALLLRSMQDGGQDIFEQLMTHLNRGGKCPPARNIQLPVPDERFFNAALDLFGRFPGMYIREAKTSESRWTRLTRREFNRFVKTGEARYPQDPMLMNVVQAMHRAGYKIPTGFRRLFIGRHVPPPSEDAPLNRQKPSPYAFGHKQHFKSYHLQTTKSRGLPVRRRRKVFFRRTKNTRASS